jgi:hypothetical protein
VDRRFSTCRPPTCEKFTRPNALGATGECPHGVSIGMREKWRLDSTHLQAGVSPHVPRRWRRGCTSTDDLVHGRTFWSRIRSTDCSRDLPDKEVCAGPSRCVFPDLDALNTHASADARRSKSDRASRGDAGILGGDCKAAFVRNALYRAVCSLLAPCRRLGEGTPVLGPARSSSLPTGLRGLHLGGPRGQRQPSNELCSHTSPLIGKANQDA